VEQVSRGAEVQRDRVESTATAMTEMNATVLEVTRNAGQAS
jgi:methyl-accepting chemotaxis protein